MIIILMHILTLLSFLDFKCVQAFSDYSIGVCITGQLSRFDVSTLIKKFYVPAKERYNIEVDTVFDPASKF